MLLKGLVSAILLIFSLHLFAQEYIKLWPDGKMPNSRGMHLERVEERERVTQIDDPGMYVFTPSKEENTGAAVLIFPPGGYRKLTYNIAGIQLAKWFNTMGINAFVLMYRLPTSPDLIERHKGPVQDAQRAMKIIRSKCAEWGISDDKIGVFGSSAGGHLASALSTFDDDMSIIDDSLDQENFKPDFQILVSPVISMVQAYHQGSRDALLGDNPSEVLLKKLSCELNTSSTTPPALIIHADNDPVVSPLNAILYYQSLNSLNIPASLHIFPYGGHSIALRNNPGSTNLWTSICESWLLEIQIISRSSD